MKDVILKLGIFPPSQTSYILQEKSILLFCSLWEHNPNGLLRSFLFPQIHKLLCLEKHGERFQSCQPILFCCRRTYRCQMLRASKAASSTFPHKEHSHFLLHPKRNRWQTSCSLEYKGVSVWYPTRQLITYTGSEQDFALFHHLQTRSGWRVCRALPVFCF